MSITGNELAQKFGRLRLVTVVIDAAACLSLATGRSAAIQASVAALFVIVWNASIDQDSSALTAGTVAAADENPRGAAMGLHSRSGYADGFNGPPGVGLALDFAGPDTVQAWGLGFGRLSAVILTGLAPP